MLSFKQTGRTVLSKQFEATEFITYLSCALKFETRNAGTEADKMLLPDIEEEVKNCQHE